MILTLTSQFTRNHLQPPSISTGVSSSKSSISVAMPVMMKPASLYEVLRVERTATIPEIKKAYRKLAKVYHPDAGYEKNGDGSASARVGLVFNSDLDSGSNSFILMKALEITASSYSHKKKVLNFLDQLCSFYGSSQDSQSSQTLMDKISELADASGIQSKGFMSALSEFSVSKFTSQLKKVQ